MVSLLDATLRYCPCATSTPVMPMTPEDVDRWLAGSSVADAFEMQKPAADDAVVVRPLEEAA